MAYSVVVYGEFQLEWYEYFGKWTLFIIRLRLLIYFVFRTRSICFRNIYQLQMALGV